jgi:hypothetical protein
MTIRGVAIAIGLLLSALIVALALAFAWGRLRPLSADEREAVALMQQDRRPPHENEVWPIIWLYDTRAPVEKMSEVYRDELDYFKRKTDAGQAGTFELWQSPAEMKFGILPPLDTIEKEILCNPSLEDCLAKATAKRDATAALLQKQMERIERTRLIVAGDDAWNTMPTDVRVPFGGIDQKRLLLTQAAFDFAQGRRVDGLRELCGSALGWRRLRQHSNTVLSSLTFVSNEKLSGQLFAQMLAKMPVDESLPGECQRAFATPTIADVDLCTVMQSELSSTLSLLHMDDRQEDAWSRLQSWVAVDEKQMIRNISMHHAPYCRVQRSEEMLAGRSVATFADSFQLDAFDMISNSGGNMLALIGVLAHDGYAQRMEDYAMSLRLFATALWLRETRTDGRPLTRRFVERPASMRIGGTGDIVLALDGRNLSFPLQFPKPSGSRSMTIPLPAGL